MKKKCNAEITEIKVHIMLPDRPGGGVYAPKGNKWKDKILGLPGINSVSGPHIGANIVIMLDYANRKTIIMRCMDIINEVLY